MIADVLALNATVKQNKNATATAAEKETAIAVLTANATLLQLADAMKIVIADAKTKKYSKKLPSLKDTLNVIAKNKY